MENEVVKEQIHFETFCCFTIISYSYSNRDGLGYQFDKG